MTAAPHFAAPDGYVIRPAAPDDASALAALVNALADELDGGNAGVDAARTRDVFFSDRYGLRSLVVEQAGAVVGYASHRLEFESAFNAVGRYLSDLYVAPDHRRRGVARALIAAVARLTADEGGAFVWWVARADPQATDALYRRLADVEAPVTAFAATQDRFRALAAAASDKP